MSSLSLQPLTRANVGSVARYYTDGADDYYRKDGEAYAWWGNGAKALGLEGVPDDDRLRAIMAGDVGDGKQSTRAFGRKDSKQRLGLDLTFSPPKSISLQALVHGDKRVIEAHDKAVERALEAAQALALARTKEGGVTRVEHTRSLIVARFRHETSRDVDPQLHTHAIVMNLTQRADGEWRALRNDEIVANKRHLENVYRSELALGLTRIGFELRQERNGAFELAHISRRQLMEFSRRGQKIEAELAAQGLTRETATHAEKQAVTLTTRKAKRQIDREAVYYEWRERAREISIDFTREGTQRQGPQIILTAKGAVDYAVKHLIEREAVLYHNQVVEFASKHTLGRVSVGEIEAEIRARAGDGQLVAELPRYRAADAPSTTAPLTKEAMIGIAIRDGASPKDARKSISAAILRGQYIEQERRYTVQGMLSAERAILAMERDGRGAVVPVRSREAADRALAAAELNAGQREAAARILSSANRVTAIQGKAGTGKTHLLQTVVPMLEADGYTVQAMASYGQPVKDLRDAGIPTRTLQSFLNQRRAITDKHVLILDEAGVVPTRLMEPLLRKAEKAGARLVLIGDTGQTKAIEAGRPFAQLQRNGMETAIMDENQRQQTDHMREAVQLASVRKGAEALHKVDAVQAIRDNADRWTQIADTFTALSAAERERTLIVAGTNEARRAINKRVRETLGTDGKGIEVDLLHRVDTTQAERGFAKNYHLGEVIIPERDYDRLGLKRGELYTVTDRGPGNRLTVRGADGQTHDFSPRHAKKLSVYEREGAELARDDLIRITRNDPDLDLTNGDRFRVQRVTRQEITLTDGNRVVRLPADTPLHLDYAHASTVHAAQGVTADRVLIDAHSRSKTSTADVFYVAVSRARDAAMVFTDDPKKLAERIGVEQQKLAALDIRHRERQAPQIKRENAGLQYGSGD